MKNSVHNLESFMIPRELKTMKNCAMTKVDVELA